ncbi:MAG: DUF4416 family protein [Planctomycetes bacterium]|nr:DUF4416 family protein [Planctomycetota bacterium]
MWEIKTPEPVKLICGILASDQESLQSALVALSNQLGPFDLKSEVWPFTQTTYYRKDMGPHILRQFVAFSEVLSPGALAKIKHRTNALEQELSQTLHHAYPRPVNLDPGFIEPSKLVLASTKNFSHRIYIGKGIYAEVTLVVDRGQWSLMRYTYPDYRQECYWAFFESVRTRLMERLKSNREARHPVN